MAPKPVQVSQFGPDSTAEDYYNALEYSTLFELERSFFRAAPDVTWDRYGVEALAFEGGGTKGVAYGGALRRLEKTGILANIKYLSGTSAGAQTAALVAVGYSADEVIKVLADAPWTELFDDSYGCFRDLYRLNTGFGIYKGDFLEKYLDGLFEAKLGIKNITLGQLYARTGVHIKLGVISVKERAFVMLDYTNEPSMPLALAARASSALPGIFTAVEWRDNRYVDGGLLGNLPSEAFPGMKLLVSYCVCVCVCACGVCVCVAPSLLSMAFFGQEAARKYTQP
ncbi:acyl transferase/acyl hydrolase/lysophospholipase [Pavlovales sp. CCMP2436]|nr:acyl transferase/acyl hydrolase/lysophospholipase [Pavlovales sp. CCMP2436]